jgi:hypothetical protein
MASTDPWWVIVGTSYGSQPTFDIFQASQADAETRSKQIVEVSTQQNLFGPYQTKADAQQAAGGQGADPVTAPTAGGNPLSGVEAPFTDTAHALSGFYEKLTDGKMWRSLAWLLLGVILMFAGATMIIGPSASRMSPLGAAKAALG